MPKLTESARGVYIIAATPFTETGALDLESASRLVEFYLERGVAGMTILGMMGEAPKLTGDEAITFARHMIARVDGRVPVVVGVSSPGFAAMAELSKAVMDAGAAGVMVSPPAAAAKGDAAVRAYFDEVARAVGDAPWVLQDFPLASSVPIPAKLVREIADAHASCVMLKHEDWPGLDKITALRRMEETGARRLSILVGNGGIFLPHELERGADGAMTGFAYPEMLVQVCRLHEEGRGDAMLDLFDAYLPLVRYEQQPGQGLAARKYVLKKRGAIASETARSPAPRLSAETRAEIDRLILRLERRLEG